MGVERMAKCDVEGCGTMHVARHDKDGFPGWGGVHGLINEHGDGMAYLCPEHMAILKKLLGGQIDGLD